jgi:hypothetical protein
MLCLFIAGPAIFLEHDSSVTKCDVNARLPATEGDYGFVKVS